MKKKSILTIALVAIIATAAFLVQRVAFAKTAPAYRFVTIQKGDLQSKVSATGTLQAVTTVSVGTQVSGQVSELFVDYNDHVKKGQLLARIDPTLAQQAISDAQANLDKARAQALQSSRDYVRNRELLGDGLVAKSAYEQTQSAEMVAQAGVKSAQVALDRARQNLAYTNIYAPIDGVVVERNVQKGQTVAASLSAPQLFLIANDLNQMQILAQVSESDIAQIKQGQPVSFTVQALPNDKFKGTVDQVRLQSTTSDNVVNYTVVVSVDNSSGKLLPGMTARVDFLTKSATDVLMVSNAALRYRPSDDELAKLRTQRQATQTSTTSTEGRSRGSRSGGGSGNWQRKADAGMVWYLDDKGQLKPARVRTGVSDGTSTEIEGKTITEGMKVIAGLASTTQTAQKSTTSSPFGSNQQQQQRGPRPGGF